MTLRGDICPPWCGAEHHDDRAYQGRPLHPDDQGVMHRRSVDRWRPRYDGDRDAEEIDVWIEAKRYDFDADGDWLEIYADNVHPGFVCDLGLQVEDARRLGEALIRACDIVDSGNRMSEQPVATRSRPAERRTSTGVAR
ncbi:hypothetical protein [Nocardioides sp. Iso805N]|uniref:hypothetical protein n=1 Tax=Nocardioides sp. Iso805N TaxID=1283287 RepID=UPI000376B61D|nr:hypothetical protein [Nocardioides sp. Iso805N]